MVGSSLCGTLRVRVRMQSPEVKSNLYALPHFTYSAQSVKDVKKSRHDSGVPSALKFPSPSKDWSW